MDTATIEEVIDGIERRPDETWLAYLDRLDALAGNEPDDDTDGEDPE